VEVTFSPLRLLLIEDSAADAELLLRELRRLQRPIEYRRVASARTLESALDEFPADIILSDYSMPGFGGQDALEIVLSRAPLTPFVYVSGTLGEERAIEALQRGASDYVLKDNLRRLPTAVDRALRMARERVEREQMQRALRDSEERFRTIVETSRDWIWENDASLHMTYSNGAVAEILGYRPEELEGRAATELMLDEDRREVEARMPRLIDEQRGWHRWRLRWRHRDGGCKVLESTGAPRFDEHGNLSGFRGIDHDVTDHLRQEARIREFARIHAVLSAVGSSALRAADREALLRNACRIAVEQGGFKAAGVGVRDEHGALVIAQTFGDRELIEAVAPREPMALDGTGAYSDHPGIRSFRDNRIVAVQDFGQCSDLPETLCRQMLEHGVHSQISLPIGSAPWGLLALYSDSPRVYDAEEIALLRRLADEIDHAVDFIAKGERLEYLAYHNPVTGLPNRAAFLARLRSLLPQGPVLVAALDIRGFGRINHSRGYAFGEELLRQLAARLQELAAPGLIVAHPERDMFLLAYRAESDAGIAQEAERLNLRLRDFEGMGFMVHSERVHLGLRTGITLAPLHGRDADELERNAISALAETPRLQTSLCVFSSGLHERAARLIELERDLRRAIDERQFELFFQPKFDTRERRLAGAEALLRWRHPEHGLIPPAEFIPVLEDTGLIVPVGEWVLRKALQTAIDWRSRGCADLRIAVNVSARELRNERFLEQCGALLDPHRADQPIDIEVTESVLIDDIDQSIRLLQALRDHGCRVAIDDFGTGYSSLNYLVRLPIDTVKIDRSFVAMLTRSPETVVLVTSMIGLSHSLGLEVVAEGVEGEAEAALLHAHGCDILQGFLLARPLPEAEFEKRVLGI
jgi:PAS domain S-box-containing protein